MSFPAWLVLGLLFIARSVPTQEKYSDANKSSNQSCVIPQWKLPKSERLQRIIQYSSNGCEASVLRCYCLTPTNTSIVNSSEVDYVLGQCIEGCFIADRYSEYYKVPVSGKWRGSLCAQYNRAGPLCGECVPGHGPAPYSFSIRCFKCPKTGLWKRALLYILIAYGPLTFFLALILVFTVSSNSAPLRGWILVCQITSSSFSMRTFTRMAELKHIDQYSYRILGTFYGVWNLDFFRPLYEPFCLNPRLTTLQALALDILVAAYPLLVIVVLYVLVEMYNQRIRLLVVVWWPFHKLFLRFRQQLDVRTSLVDAFGTFFDLSFVKMFCTIMELMAGTKVWENGNNKPSLHTYFEGGTHYFGKSHLPFVVIGIFLLLGFYVLPIVLILIYSFPRCQCFIHHLPRSVRLCIYPFMDNILSCYKDGTNGTSNCRYFAVVYHILRMTALSTVVWTKSLLAFPFAAVAVIITILLVALIRPYKSALYNSLDIFFLVCLSLGLLGNTAFSLGHVEDPEDNFVSLIVIYFSCTPPLLYYFFKVGYKVWGLRERTWKLMKKTTTLLLSVYQKMRVRNVELCESSYLVKD